MAELEHLSEEQLLWHYYGEENLDEHLGQCRRCTEQFEALKASLAAVNLMTAPEPEPGYEDRLWRSLVKRDASLSPRRRWWDDIASPWRLAWIGGLAAAMLLAAFLAGRFSSRQGLESPSPALDAGAVRERLLVAALGEHLEQSERMLLEIDNQGSAGARQQAENLLAANRLYRQTAQRQGKILLAATLDDLERVLLDVAHAPDTMSADQLRQLRARVDEQGLLFKVRVLGLKLRDLDSRPLPRNSRFSTLTKG